MRVLQVITGLAAGGAEQQLRLLVRHLSADCTVATLTNPGMIADAIQAEGTPVVHLGMGGSRDVTVLPRLAALIRRGGYDVVHTHLYRASVYGRLAARLAGARHVVATEHSLGELRIEGRPRSAGVRQLYLRTERLGAVTIAVSGAVARRLVEWGVPPARIAIVPNGVEAADFSYDPTLRGRVRAELDIGPAERVVGAVGRLHSGKRFDLLVRALAGLDATLLLVGAGHEQAALVRLAEDCGVLGRLRLVGEVVDVRPLLCAMDVLAAPSEEETFGLAVIEALACGLPVRYVSCPALDDLPAAAAPQARRVPPDVTALRAGLAEAVRSPAGREPAPAAAHYAVDRMAGRIADLYQHVRSGSSLATFADQTPYTGVR